MDVETDRVMVSKVVVSMLAAPSGVIVVSSAFLD
jgi:hypothetical protein